MVPSRQLASSPQEHPAPPRRRGVSGYLLRVALAVVLVDALLAQAERAWWHSRAAPTNPAPFRIRSDLYHHDLAPMVDTIASWGSIRYPFRTDSLGFRDASTRNVPLRTPRRRMLITGSALTEGMGVPYEQTFAGLIAVALDQRGVEVLNAAVAGYVPSIHYRKIRHLLEDVGLELDEAVVFLDPADIHDEALLFELDQDHDVVRLRQEGAPGFVTQWTDGAEHIVPPLIERVDHWLREHSFAVGVAAAIRDAHYVEGREGLPPKTGESRVLWTVDQQLFSEYGRAGLEKARRSMDLLLAQLRSRSIPLTIAVYPWPDQIARDDLTSMQVVFWRQWAEERGVRFIDLFPPFFEGAKGDERLGRYFIADDVHFNAAGHRLVAEQFLAHYAGERAASRAQPNAASTSAAARSPDSTAPSM